MTDRALSPPNSRCLSDAVIGSVLQHNMRATHSLSDNERFEVDGAGHEFGLALTYEPRSRVTYRFHEKFRRYTTRASVVDRPPRLKYPLRRAAEEENSHSAISTADQNNDDAETCDEEKVKLRRERRRLTQLRYRAKQQKNADSLVVEVQALREEVRRLELQHQIISPRVTVDRTPWNVVAEYFRLFRYALTAFVPAEKRCTSPKSECIYDA
ncbi:hypothetical protein ON010_g1645 [Phytophthora cinnamomi]|nr:hypothetical protein ON010_g1645 [Phytophthora cinnamomi]